MSESEKKEGAQSNQGSGRAIGEEHRSDAEIETDGSQGYMKSLRWGETDQSRTDRKAEEKRVLNSKYPPRPLLERVLTAISNLWGRV